MIIKFDREEILKFFKWKTRRKLKKHERKKKKNPEYKKKWDNFVNDVDNMLAGVLDET